MYLVLSIYYPSMFMMLIRMVELIVLIILVSLEKFMETQHIL